VDPIRDLDGSPAKRARAERENAGRERELARRELHLAFLYGGPREDEHREAAKRHREAARRHDLTADRIERER
jgi:hypothetical protein